MKAKKGVSTTTVGYRSTMMMGKMMKG